MLEVSQTPRVLVCHPGRQYSHELALALAERHMLAKYFTGVPANRRGVAVWQRPFMKKYISNYELNLESRLVEHHFIASFLRKFTSRLLKRPAAVDWSHRADALFDRQVSQRLWRFPADAIVGYEHACQKIFTTAKRQGQMTVLDAASFHHKWQDRHYLPVESEAAHKRINRRKDEEIELADFILTVSDLARESYLDAGVSPDRVASVPLGSDLSLFQPTTTPKDSSAPLRFLFVGHIGERKGADLLLQAAKRIQEAEYPFELGLAGKPESNLDFTLLKNCKILGWLPHRELSKVMTQYDVLVLPSRHDSFGMVVAEAMASGLPAIVSDMVGAKELVVPQQNGDIVRAGCVDSLTDSLVWFIRNRTQLGGMRNVAITTAQNYGWLAYHNRVIDRMLEFWHIYTNQLKSHARS